MWNNSSKNAAKFKQESSEILSMNFKAVCEKYHIFHKRLLLYYFGKGVFYEKNEKQTREGFD